MSAHKYLKKCDLIFEMERRLAVEADFGKACRDDRQRLPEVCGGSASIVFSSLNGKKGLCYTNEN